MSFTIQGFEFPSDTTVRQIECRDGTTWWYLVDICKLIGVTSSNIPKFVPKQYLQKHPQPNGYIYVISEAGIYYMMLSSYKPIARRFKEWLVQRIEQKQIS